MANNAGVDIPVRLTGLLDADARIKAARERVNELITAMKRVRASGGTINDGLAKAYLSAKDKFEQEKATKKRFNDDLRKHDRIIESARAAGENYRNRQGPALTARERVGGAVRAGLEFKSNVREVYASGRKVLNALDQGWGRGAAELADEGADFALASGNPYVMAAGAALKLGSVAAHRIMNAGESKQIAAAREQRLSGFRGSRADLLRNAEADARKDTGTVEKIENYLFGAMNSPKFQRAIDAKVEARLQEIKQGLSEVRERAELSDWRGALEAQRKINETAEGAIWRSGTKTIAMLEQSRIARRRHAAMTQARAGSRTGD